MQPCNELFINVAFPIFDCINIKRNISFLGFFKIYLKKLLNGKSLKETKISPDISKSSFCQHLTLRIRYKH